MAKIVIAAQIDLDPAKRLKRFLVQNPTLMQLSPKPDVSPMIGARMATIQQE